MNPRKAEFRRGFRDPARLPKKKSAGEKLLLAAAMKRTTSAPARWLAQRLQMGAASSVGTLVHPFRRSGALDRPAITAILSKFLARPLGPAPRAWLAQRLQLGAPTGLGSLLHRFRGTGATDRPEIKSVLSRFLP